MPRCTSEVDLYANAEFCPGDASLPGVRPHFYTIKKADILTFPAVKGTSATSMGEVCVIDGSFVLAESKTWKRHDLIDGESEPSCESQGSEGSKSFLNRVNLVLPGTQKEVSGLIALLNNDDVVIAYPQRDGKIRIIGNEMFKVQFELGQNGGRAVTDSAQTTINASVTDVCPAPFYEGDLVTADGTISGATDALVPVVEDDHE
ncbi:MAG: hypothetical protein K5683_02855 [Prevotella sp.]|nr:hypothetical protein [Prevotella sp.]